MEGFHVSFVSQWRGGGAWMRALFDLLQPWHLVVFAVAAFLFFGAIGVFGGSGRVWPWGDR
jgi:hypothetical protein